MPNKIHYAYCLMKSDKKIALKQKSKNNAQKTFYSNTPRYALNFAQKT